MKLALRCALVLVLAALGVLLWMRNESEGDAVKPQSVDLAPATANAPEQLAPLPSAAAETTQSPREEVASSPVSYAGWTLLRARVISQASGKPLANVRVRLVPQSSTGNFFAVDVESHRGAPGANPRTDVDGRVDFVVEPEVEYVLSVSANNGATDSLRVAALTEFEVRDVELHLPVADDLVFFGHVIDDVSGAPITAARVDFDAARDAYNARNASVPTPEESNAAQQVDADGRFTLRSTSGLTRVGICSAEGYPRVKFTLGPGHDTRERALEIRLAKAATVEVLVRDRHQTIENAELRLATDTPGEQLATGSEDIDLADGHSWAATTDVNGRARVLNVPAKAPFVVTVQVPKDTPRREPQLLTLEPGETRSLEIIIGSGGIVSGRVEDREGRPIAWPVWLAPSKARGPRLFLAAEEPAKSSRAQEDGRFRFDDVPLGRWDIGVAPPDVHYRVHDHRADFSGLTQTIEIRDGSEELELVLVVDHGLFLRGTVVDPNGAPVVKTLVLAGVTSDGAFTVEESDDHGHFEIGPLPAGNWVARAWPRRTDNAQSADVVAAAGTNDIVLRLRAAGSISGTIVDQPSHAVLHCDLVLASLESEREWRVSDSEAGTFEFGFMVPGQYVVCARSSDGLQTHRRVEIKAGEVVDNVELILERGAQLLLRYASGNDRCRFRIFVDQELVDVGELMQWESQTRSVPPGAIEVRWWIPSLDFKETQSLTLAVGERGELVWKGKP